MLSVARAARLLGKSKDTIYRWLEEGKLSGCKAGGRWIIYQDSVEAAWEAAVVEREYQYNSRKSKWLEEMHMDSVEKEWYDKANSYQPQPGKNYGWVLDYAKFRLKFTFGNARYLEEKKPRPSKICFLGSVRWLGSFFLLAFKRDAH